MSAAHTAKAWLYHLCYHLQIYHSYWHTGYYQLDPTRIHMEITTYIGKHPPEQLETYQIWLTYTIYCIPYVLQVRRFSREKLH